MLALRKRLYSVTPCLFSDLIEIYDIVLNGKVTAFIHVNMCHKPCLSYSHYLSIHYNDKGNTTAVFLPGKSHGQRSLVGHSPGGRMESTRLSNFHFPEARDKDQPNSLSHSGVITEAAQGLRWRPGGRDCALPLWGGAFDPWQGTKVLHAMWCARK